MNDVLKTFGCVAAYAAGLVVGVTATSMIVAKIEKKSISRNMNKLVSDLAAVEAGNTPEIAAALATTFGTTKKAAKAA